MKRGKKQFALVKGGGDWAKSGAGIIAGDEGSFLFKGEREGRGRSQLL